SLGSGEEGRHHRNGIGRRHMPDVFGDQVRATLEERAEQPALCYRSQWRTFGQIRGRAAAVAATLRELGLERSDRVALFSPDKLPYLHVHLGAMLAGGMSLPVNFRSPLNELAYFISDSGARFIFAGPEQLEIAEQAKATCPTLEHVLTQDWYESLEPCDRLPGADLKPDDMAMMLYTSGTTGRPKGAVHTHGSMASAVGAIAECWAFTPDDTLLNVLPLFHIHGLSFASHVWLTTGGRMIVQDAFHPRRTLEALSEATAFMGVPPYYYSWLDWAQFRERAGQFGHIRLFTCGSAPIRPEVLPELQEILGGPIINRYGMTETHVNTSLPLGGPHKMGSVGLALSGIEVEVRGDEDDEGEAGEVWVRGPNLFTEYWNRPEATAEAFDADGWFDTGDLGEQDEDAFLTLRGRSKDLIIVGGYNVYPPVVECVINDCPGVKESALIGVPDRRRGERVMAVVVRDDPGLTEETITAFCRERLVDYQCPARVEFVPELPRNTMGKVLKRELRDRFASSDG
ncbi:MAG: class I adenylate-forming enzyme family protein, partial [Armatimonadota bacterium]